MSSLEKHDVEKLNAGNYARIRPLIAELRYNLVIDSIIEDHTPAWVYVDRRSTPQLALFYDPAGWEEHDMMKELCDEIH